MEIEIKNYESLDKFMKDIVSDFKKICDDIGVEYEYKPGKKEEKVEYNLKCTPTADNTSEVAQLKQLLSEKYKEIENLKKRNEELVKINKTTNDNKYMNSVLKDMIKNILLSNLNNYVEDIKTCIEKARMAQLIDDKDFIKQMQMVWKTADDFIASRPKW